MKKDECINGPTKAPESPMIPELKDCGLIGPSAVSNTASCPCCNRHLKSGRQTVGETRPQSLYDSLFMDDGSDTESSHSFEDLDDMGSMMPGVLSGGVPYTITENLVQGWMHKKGTGMDWMGSRAWKPRWAVLSVSSNERNSGLLQTIKN